MLQAAQKNVMPGPEEMESLSIAVKNHMFGLDGPTQTRIGPRTQKQIYFGKLFYGFMEIFECLEALEDIAFMAQRFPFPETRISPDRYLRFLVEAHYGEIYILRGRLEQYLTMIERQFKGDQRHQSIRSGCTKLTNLLRDALDGVLRIRHHHVHLERFSDVGIDRLKSIGLIATNARGKVGRLMKTYYRIEYASVRSNWLKTMRKNNKELRKLLDAVTKPLFTVVFDKETLAFNCPAGFV